MKIRSRSCSGFNTLILEAKTPEEERQIEEFARENEPLTAKIERSKPYVYNCIIIKKERT